MNWISFQKEYPPITGYYIFVKGSYLCFFGRWDADRSVAFDMDGDIVVPTHWMELPESPEPSEE